MVLVNSKPAIMESSKSKTMDENEHQTIKLGNKSLRTRINSPIDTVLCNKMNNSTEDKKINFPDKYFKDNCVLSENSINGQMSDSHISSPKKISLVKSGRLLPLIRTETGSIVKELNLNESFHKTSLNDMPMILKDQLLLNAQLLSSKSSSEQTINSNNQLYSSEPKTVEIPNSSVSMLNEHSNSSQNQNERNLIKLHVNKPTPSKKICANNSTSVLSSLLFGRPGPKLDQNENSTESIISNSETNKSENYLMSIKKRCKKKVGRRDKHLLLNTSTANEKSPIKPEASTGIKSNRTSIPNNKSEIDNDLVCSTSELEDDILKDYLVFLYGEDALSLAGNNATSGTNFYAIEESNSSNSTLESYKSKSMKNKFDYRKDTAETKPYICGICSKSFGQHSNIVLHMRSHTGEKPYVCDICGKGFSGKSDLNRHKNIHSSIKKYWCQECQRGFNDNSGFRRHKLIYHSASSHKCHICPKSYLALKDLERHLKTHLKKDKERKSASPEVPKPEPIPSTPDHSDDGDDDGDDDASSNTGMMDDSSTGNSTLTDNSASSSEAAAPQESVDKVKIYVNNPTNPYAQSTERPHKCGECEFSCSKRSNLRKHIAYVHCLERFYKCDICFKGFKSSWALKRHRQVHSEEKTYQCELCEKGFNDTGSFKYHMKIHRGEKPFQCDICAKSFILKSDLKKHMTTHIKKFYSPAEEQDNDDNDMEVLIQTDHSFLNLASYVQSSGR